MVPKGNIFCLHHFQFQPLFNLPRLQITYIKNLCMKVLVRNVDCITFHSRFQRRTSLTFDMGETRILHLKPQVCALKVWGDSCLLPPDQWLYLRHQNRTAFYETFPLCNAPCQCFKYLITERGGEKDKVRKGEERETGRGEIGKRRVNPWILLLHRILGFESLNCSLVQVPPLGDFHLLWTAELYKYEHARKL